MHAIQRQGVPNSSNVAHLQAVTVNRWIIISCTKRELYVICCCYSQVSSGELLTLLFVNIDLFQAFWGIHVFVDVKFVILYRVT